MRLAHSAIVLYEYKMLSQCEAKNKNRGLNRAIFSFVSGLVPYILLCFILGSYESHGQSLRKNPSGHPGYFHVFQPGSAPLVIVQPEKLGDHTQAAISEFQRVAQKMVGATIFAIPQDNVPSLFRKITLEKDVFPEKNFFPAGEDDRFRIVVGKRGIRIQAASEIGWEFGLYTLLDTFGGVRWFWPGEDGTYIPENKNWRIPYGTHEFSPGYVSRAFSGLRGPEDREWERRNRLRRAYRFSHNLHRIFSRELYLQEPELHPHEWDREDPPPSQHPLWRYHPDLTMDRTVEIAAHAAMEFFEKHPDEPSFALGLNDNVVFGDNASIMEIVRPMRYFRDQPVYTDLVFQFMNRVAERIAPYFPNKYLGALAYWWAEAPPSFPLHPMILPYLTADRSQGYNANFTEEDRQLVRDWMKTGVNMVGIYEYAHGAPHPYPRRANLLIGLRIRDAHEAGARAYFAEVNPIWPFQGDMPWMMARMLWDPTLDPGTLEKEFTEKFFEGAAKPMYEFYSETRWIWMRQRGSPVWVKHFHNEAGIEIYSSDDLARLTALLERAVLLADDPLIKKRVQAVKNAWQLSLLWAQLQQTRNALVLHTKESIRPADIYLFWNARKKWEEKTEKLSQQEWMRNVARTRFLQSDPSYQAVKNLLLATSSDLYFQTLDGLTAESMRLKDRSAQATIRAAHRAIQTRGGKEKLVKATTMSNALGAWIHDGPEPWEVRLNKPWSVRMSPSEQVSLYFKEDTGNLRIEKAHGAGVAFEFTPVEDVLYEARIEWNAVLSHGNRTQFGFKWWDENGIPIGLSRSLRLPLGKHREGGVSYVFGYPPQGAAKGALEITTVRQEKEIDWLEIESVEVIAYPKQ